MPVEAASRALKAAGEPTRLRLLMLLARSEATVGELQAVLAQSQPRVSRHLRLLTEAGLVERFRDGHWVYYRLAGDAWVQSLVAVIGQRVGAEDGDALADMSALDAIKQSRRRDAYRSDSRAPRAPASLDRPDLETLRETIEEALGDGDLGEVIAVGCGSGSLLPVLARRARLLVGIDTAQTSRVLARSRVHESGLPNCTIRAGDPRRLDFSDAQFDVVVLDEVLTDLGAADKSLSEALRLLKPGGRLLILDRIKPVASRLTAGAANNGLIDNPLTAAIAAAGGRVSARRWLPGRSPDYALFTVLSDYSPVRTGTYD